MTTTTARRVTFNSHLRTSQDNFKTTVKMLHHLADNLEGVEFDTLWELVSSKPQEHYTRHFRRENKRNNPLSDVKRPRTAYSFFTQEQRNAISAKHTDKSFGEVSKLVAAAWGALSEKKRAPYRKLEAADKERYETEKATVLAAAPVVEETTTSDEVEEQTEEVTEQSVDEPSSPSEPSPKRAKSKTSSKGRGGKARKSRK